MPVASAHRMSDALAQAAASARVDRIASAGAHDTLERIQSSALLGTGAVNMIGLDSIRRQLGDRWPAKRARVWEHVELELQRKLGPADLAVRVDDINYLIAAPSAQGFAAQALCLSVLQDVLKFFLGEIRTGDIAIRTVTELSSGSIVTGPGRSRAPAASRRSAPAWSWLRPGVRDRARRPRRLGRTQRAAEGLGNRPSPGAPA